MLLPWLTSALQTFTLVPCPCDFSLLSFSGLRLFYPFILALSSFFFPFPILCLMFLTFLFSTSSWYTVNCPLLRKLPWLSRQSDRLLTDRSMVRSHAEASFLLFHCFLFFLFFFPSPDFPCLKKKYASRGSRTHDRAVKSRALYRLS